MVSGILQNLYLDMGSKERSGRVNRKVMRVQVQQEIWDGKELEEKSE